MPNQVPGARSFKLRSVRTGHQFPGGRIHPLLRAGFYTDRLRGGSSVHRAATQIYREHMAAVLEYREYVFAGRENLWSPECQVLIQEFEEYVLALNERLNARLRALTSNTAWGGLSLITSRPLLPAVKKDEELSKMLAAVTISEGQDLPVKKDEALSKMLANVTISEGGHLPEKCSASAGAAGPSGHHGRKDDEAGPSQDN